MTSTEIVREIQRLPVQQQFEIQETLTRLLKDHESSLDAHCANRTGLALAARALLADYQTDTELTAFTALDSEDFHASR